jgi:NADPH oxidase
MYTLPREKQNKIIQKYVFTNIHPIVCCAWITFQVSLIIYFCIVLSNNINLDNLMSTISYGFIIAKVSALMININFLILFLVMNKRILSTISNISYLLPINCHIQYHIYIVYLLLFYSFVHVLAHLYNFYIIDNGTYMSLINTSAGVTGIILIILFSIICIFSIKYIRNNYFELFAITHLLYIFIIITIIFHGSFCFLQDINENCISGQFWMYIIIPFSLFIIERCYREYNSYQKTIFLDIKKYHGNCNEITFYKTFFEYHPGQWVLINCPKISAFQWHPFTITSNPIENGLIQVVIKERGDWTKQFIKLLDDDIKIKISYPYGYRYDVITKYRVAVLIAGGIGITAFMGLIKSLSCSLGHGNKHVYLKKVYLYWTCKDIKDFHCFVDTLKKIKLELDKYGDFFIIELFITGLSMSNRLSLYPPVFNYIYGRPNFDTIFSDLCKLHPSNNIKLFLCGSKKMNDDLLHIVKKFNNTNSNTTQFIYQPGEIFT